MKDTLLIFSIIFFLLTGCSKAVIDEVEPVVIDQIIKYDPDVKKIVSTNCYDCHAGSSPIAGFTLETYNDVKAYTEAGILIDKINDIASPMPPTGLMPAYERAVIEKWVVDGYLEN